MKEFVIYTGMRLFLLILAILVVGGIWAAFSSNVNEVAVLLIALVLSGIASYFLLNRQRDAFAQVVERRAAKATAAFEQMKAKEDDN